MLREVEDTALPLCCGESWINLTFLGFLGPSLAPSQGKDNQISESGCIKSMVHVAALCLSDSFIRLWGFQLHKARFPHSCIPSLAVRRQ